jgi:hypothetical protein
VASISKAMATQKKITWLGFNQTGCPNAPPSPPSGDPSQCKSTVWGDTTNSDNLCVRTLANLRGPIDWPYPPPTPPTPTTLAAGAPYPTAWYASKCIDLGGSTGTFGDAQHPNHGAGIYCVSGPGTFQINGLNSTAGDGYTFFALGGGTINFAGNSSNVKFYWPSACGARPTTRSGSFTCFGRTISGYDPQTVLYATNPSTNGSCAVCLNGGSNTLTGDIFATKPDIFPPASGQIGGLVSISGGGLAAGTGFIESWNLSMNGNTGTYSGTGTSIVVPGQTHTTTDPNTVTTIVFPDSTTPSTVLVTTLGTTINLNQ